MTLTPFFEIQNLSLKKWFFHSFFKKINQKITYSPFIGFSDHEIGPKNRRITNIFYEFMRMHYKWRNFQEANLVPRQPPVEIFNVKRRWIFYSIRIPRSPRGEECQLLPPGWTSGPEKNTILKDLTLSISARIVGHPWEPHHGSPVVFHEKNYLH